MKAEKQLLNLDQFSSLEDALHKVEQAGERYVDVGKHGLRGQKLSHLTLFFMGALSRAQGLHSGIAREIRKTNPHAVFTLIRAYAETSIMVLYATDHPDYTRALHGPPSQPGQPKRRSMQALINYAARRFEGFKDVYADLSEIGHFGSISMWASMTVDEGKDDGSFTWTSYPRWRNEQQALIACAQTLELAEATQSLLQEFAERHLIPERAPGG